MISDIDMDQAINESKDNFYKDLAKLINVKSYKGQAENNAPLAKDLKRH